MIFEFTCYINPASKNERKMVRVWSKKQNKKVSVVNREYQAVWNQIESEMYKKRFGYTKEHFDMLHESDRIRMQKSVYNGNVILYLWNGFKRMDTSNFLTELQDRLQGIAYLNDAKIKLCPLKKLDFEKKEFFTVIVEPDTSETAQELERVIDKRYQEYLKRK